MKVQPENYYAEGLMNHDSALRAFLRLEALNKPGLIILRDQLYTLEIRYANIRAGWTFLSLEERQDSKKTRTIAHTAFIDACNILSRAMSREAEDSNMWRKEIGDDRKTIGDFACYLSCFLGIRAR